MNDLVKLGKAVQTLAEIRDRGDAKAAKDIKDAASAAKLYARKQKAHEGIRYAHGIQVEAGAIIGEVWLREGKKDGRPGKKNRGSVPTVFTRDAFCKQIGISPDELRANVFLAKLQNEHPKLYIAIWEMEKDAAEVRREIHKTTRLKTLKAMEWPKGKYRVIYADPAWAYNDKRLDSVAGGGASGSYETESTEAICARPVADLALRDSVLFLWVTSPLLPDGLKVIDAWGFKYKASFVWDKQQGFNGHYNDVHHELLLIAVRGSCTPDRAELFPSVISEPKGKHSAKPARFIEMIDAMYTLGPRIELYCRTKREGWDAWGNEVG